MTVRGVRNADGNAAVCRLRHGLGKVVLRRTVEPASGWRGPDLPPGRRQRRLGSHRKPFIWDWAFAENSCLSWRNLAPWNPAERAGPRLTLNRAQRGQHSRSPVSLPAYSLRWLAIATRQPSGKPLQPMARPVDASSCSSTFAGHRRDARRRRRGGSDLPSSRKVDARWLCRCRHFLCHIRLCCEPFSAARQHSWHRQLVTLLLQPARRADFAGNACMYFCHHITL